MKEEKEWIRRELTYDLIEPKRWWHYLGIKQQVYIYTISFYLKSDQVVCISGVLTEYSKKNNN